ncbi:hypothetical protein [Azohydromonas aeria]|nr:hypothetical protein [Azohydromonas aeria]
MQDDTMPNSAIDHRTCRPREILPVIGRCYPHAWKTCDEFRSDKGSPLPS